MSFKINQLETFDNFICSIAYSVTTYHSYHSCIMFPYTTVCVFGYRMLLLSL